MKSTSPRKKQLSFFSSQDELSMKRVPKSEGASKRSKKPSIYDEMDDDFMDQYDDKYDLDDEDEDDDDYSDEDDDDDER